MHTLTRKHRRSTKTNFFLLLKSAHLLQLKGCINVLANTKLCCLFAVAAARGKHSTEKTWESAFKSGKLSTVAVLCLQASREANDTPPPGAAFDSGSSGSPPTRPSGCGALWAQLLLWSTSQTLSARRGWRPSGSDWDYWGWVSCWHCWLSQVSLPSFCFIHILLWEVYLILWFSSWTSSWFESACVRVSMERYWKVERGVSFSLPNAKVFFSWYS